MRRVVAVACSGGRDSTALLHATARAAKAQGLEVVALHVHHGLSQHADAWLSHIEQQCSAWRDAGLPTASFPLSNVQELASAISGGTASGARMLAMRPNPAAHPAPVAKRRRFQLSSTSLLWAAIIVLAAALAFTFSHGMRTGQRKLTQDDINAAVLKTMETHVLPSEYAKAYENILPSVVRVVSYVKKSRLKEDHPAAARSGAKPKPLGPATGGAAPAADDDEVEHRRQHHDHEGEQRHDRQERQQADDRAEERRVVGRDVHGPIGGERPAHRAHRAAQARRAEQVDARGDLAQLGSAYCGLPQALDCR